MLVPNVSIIQRFHCRYYCLASPNSDLKIVLLQSSYSNTRVTGQVSGLSPGQHGFHIHLYGDFSGGCVSAGPHYNPDERNHGGPDDEERHAGDLGNIVADATGVASIDIIDAQIPLCGENSIIGRSVVVGILYLVMKCLLANFLQWNLR